MDDQKTKSLSSMVTDATSRMSEDELRRKVVREKARASELMRKKLKALAREHREVPKNFALEDFLKSTCRKKIRTSGSRGHSS